MTAACSSWAMLTVSVAGAMGLVVLYSPLWPYRLLLFLVGTSLIEFSLLFRGAMRANCVELLFLFVRGLRDLLNWVSKEFFVRYDRNDFWGEFRG